MTKIANAPMKDLVRDVMPLLTVMVGTLALMTLRPCLVLLPPRLAGYTG